MVGDPHADRKGTGPTGAPAAARLVQRGAERSAPSDPDLLPAEIAGLRGRLPKSVLRDAIARARHLGVGADEVLIASGRIDPNTATAALAAHLGLLSDPLEDASPMTVATARDVLRTGVLMSPPAAGRGPGYTLAVRGREARRLARAIAADPGLRARVRLASPEALKAHVQALAGAQIATDAAFRLREEAPEKSAATVHPARPLLIVLIYVVGLLTVGCLLDPAATWLLIQALLSLVFLAWIVLRVASCLHDPAADLALTLPDRHLPTYSILVPLYREAAVVPRLIEALCALDYPREKLDILLAVEADDAQTLAAIAAVRLPPHVQVIACPDIGPRTKPKALNMALPFARGAFIAVYDAEDDPAPDQLKRALAAFRAGGPQVACVQARLFVDNGADAWVSRHFSAEYAGLFDVLLPALSDLGLPVLLGGTSNHFRRDVLEEVGGWDPFNVTEDADLGVRLARAGWRTDVIASTTREEAPVTAKAWLGQRTRWLKGWAQTILVHGRDPVALVADLGREASLVLALLTLGPFASALVHPLCLTVIAVDLWRGVMGLPCESIAEVLASALAYTTLVAGYLGNALAAAVGLKRRGLLGHAGVLVTLPIYWLMLSLAAWRALIDLVRRPYFWAKTEHGLARRRGDFGALLPGRVRQEAVRGGASDRQPPLPAGASH